MDISESLHITSLTLVLPAPTYSSAAQSTDHYRSEQVVTPAWDQQPDAKGRGRTTPSDIDWPLLGERRTEKRVNGQFRAVIHVTWNCELALSKGCQAGPSAAALPGLEQEPGSSVGSDTTGPITTPPEEGGVRNPSP